MSLIGIRDVFRTNRMLFQAKAVNGRVIPFRLSVTPPSFCVSLSPILLMTTIYHTQIMESGGMVSGMWRDVRMCFGGCLKRDGGKHVRENPSRLLDDQRPSVYGWVGCAELSMTKAAGDESLWFHGFSSVIEHAKQDRSAKSNRFQYLQLTW